MSSPASDQFEVFWTDDRIDSLRLLLSLPEKERPTLRKIAERFGTTSSAVKGICRRKKIAVGRRAAMTPAARMANPWVAAKIKKRGEGIKRSKQKQGFGRRRRIDNSNDADLIAAFLAKKSVTKLPPGCADGVGYVTYEDGHAI